MKTTPRALSGSLLGLLSFILLGFPPALFAAKAPVVVAKFSTPPALDGTGVGWGSATTHLINNSDGRAAFLLGYDADFFYARVRVADDSPLKNSASLPQEMLKGGDAVGLYFDHPTAEGQRVLFARWQDRDEVWLYRPKSAEKKPFTFASPAGEEVFEYVAAMKEARAFTTLFPDGYMVELAIPWKSLDLEPSARMPFDLQIIFSDPSGSTNVGGLWWHANEGINVTVEDLPTEARLEPGAWGEVLLEGFGLTLPTTSVAAAKPVVQTGNAKAGTSITLDVPRAGQVSLLILDDQGWIVRELLRAEAHPAGPLTVKWDGRDRYNEPLPPGDYTWKALVFDRMGARFLGSVGNSGRPPFRTPDGLGSIGGQHGDMKSIGVDGKGVILAGATEEGPGAIRKVDPKTVAAVWRRAAGFAAAVLALKSDDSKTVFILRNRRGSAHKAELVIMDPQTGLSLGEMQKRYPVDVPVETGSPKIGLALVGDRAYYSVHAENRLGGIDLKSGQALPEIKIPSPRGLYALDAHHLLVCTADNVVKLNLATGQITPYLSGFQDAGAVCLDPAGNIYVSDLGDSQQIKKFSRDRQPLVAFGKPGGKPSQMIPYDPLAFDNIVDMAVGPDGNLWLAEVSKVPNRVVRMTTDGKWLEDICGPVAYNTFGPDLDDPRIVYYNIGGDQRFVQTHVDYDKYAANPMDPAAGWRITAIHDLGAGADGQTPNDPMASVASNAYGHVIVFTANNGHRYFFRVSKSNRASTPIGAGLWIWRSERWVPVAFLSRDSEDKKDKREKTPSWRDANDDGLMQDDERFSGLPTQTFAWIDRDLVLHGFDGTLAPASISSSGVPNYQGGVFSAHLNEGEPNYHDGWTFVSPVVDESVYYVANPGPNRRLSHWDTASENRLIKVKHGKVQWVVGQHSARAEHNEFTTVTGVAGIVDDIVVAHNVEPADYIAFTTDGFTLGNTIVDESGQRPKTGPIAIRIESFTGLFIKDPKTGRRMLFSVVSGDDRILEITGPGELIRSTGQVRLPSSTSLSDAATSLEILNTGWRGNQPRADAIDARDVEWPEDKTGYSWMADGVAVGDLQLRRDDGALHVFVSALQASPFTTGDGLELVLGPENGASKTTILLTGSFGENGKFTGQVSLSVNGEKQETKDIKIAVAPRWNQLGWKLEAKIPIKRLSELATTRPQVVRRVTKNPQGGSRRVNVSKPLTEKLPDLPAKFLFQATLISSQAKGGSQRLSIPPQGPALFEAP